MFIFDITNILDLIIVIIILVSLAILHFIKRLYKKAKLNQIQQNKELAAQIIDEFEKLLQKNNMKIPSEEREYNEDEACIYGTLYYDLEDNIIQILNKKD